MKRINVLLRAILLILVMLTPSCGSNSACKVSSSDDCTPVNENNDDDDGVNSSITGNFLPGTYLQDGSNDLEAGNFSVPAVHDWDSDGKKDLLLGYNDTGTNFGFVRFYRNVGTDSAPSFNGFTLVRACSNTCDLSVSAVPTN